MGIEGPLCTLFEVTGCRRLYEVVGPLTLDFDFFFIKVKMMQ